MSVKRVFVEKKPEYAIKARELREEIESYLDITEVTGVRVLVRYDIENISEDVYKEALGTIFSEPPVDEVFEETFPHGADDVVFSVEYLPGQFDQRADSAEQCVKLLNENEEPVIRSAMTYVISGKLSGEFLPDYVIPFAMDKKQATGIFLDWIKKKKYIPDDFFSKSQIEKFSGVYFPYLMYSCKVDGKIQAEGEKQRTWVAGNIRYTEHKKYRMERAGELDVRNVTRNALKKNNSALVEGVLPFDMEKLKLFDMGYLSGFQAEKRDMEKEALTPEVEQEVKQYTVEQLKNDVMGQYSAVRVDQSDTNIRDAKWQYALLPVWILTYRDKARKDELYYFAMNGQTGKICGKLPVAKGKLVKLFLEIFVPVAAILMIGGWFL